MQTFKWCCLFRVFYMCLSLCCIYLRFIQSIIIYSAILNNSFLYTHEAHSILEWSWNCFVYMHVFFKPSLFSGRESAVTTVTCFSFYSTANLCLPIDFGKRLPPFEKSIIEKEQKANSRSWQRRTYIAWPPIIRTQKCGLLVNKLLIDQAIWSIISCSESVWEL